MPNEPALIPATLDVDLNGLCATAAPWLAALPVSDGRIQTVPDARALRFYQSTGLLDRPTRYDGRTARYGRRHLLQVLAVRALQSHGLSLAQIQTAIASATDAQLEATVDEVVRMRTTVLRTEVLEPEPYSAFPAPPVHAPASRAPAFHAPAFTAVELAPGLVVTVDPRLHPDPTRVVALLRAAISGDKP